MPPKSKSDTADSPIPQHNTTVYGHDGAIDLFLNAWQQGRVHHAWLITGQQGIGKSTLAHKIAEYVLHNSANQSVQTQSVREFKTAPTGGADMFGDVPAPQPTPESNAEPTLNHTPNNTTALDVPTNSAITPLVRTYAHPDFRVLCSALNDKESATGIISTDQIRTAMTALLQKTPAMGGWRVVIVDSMDNVNTNGANSLLKVLEEPPERTLFLLICHNPSRLLPTIRSRCRTLPLSPLPTETITQVIADYQGILGDDAPDFPSAHIPVVANMAQGSAGMAVDYLTHNALELYQDFVQILQTLPNLDMVKIQALGNAIGGAKNRDKMRLFRRLSHQWGQAFVRSMVVGDLPPEILRGDNAIVTQLQTTASVHKWQQGWDNFNASMARVDAPTYLDGKQTLIDSFTQLNKTIT